MMTEIKGLKKYTNCEILGLFKILNACDALFLSEEDAWLNRYQFNPKWGENASMGMFDNGSGDHVFVILRDGILIKGFDHESELSRHARDDFSIYPDMYKDLPKHLEKELRDPAISFEEVTFCYWRTDDSGVFTRGIISEPTEDDGSGFLLSSIYTSADDYLEDATDYFESSENEDRIRQLYADGFDWK